VSVLRRQGASLWRNNIALSRSVGQALVGLVIDVDESEQITVAVRADDLLEGDTADPERHPIALALRRQEDVDDARVTRNETLVRRGKKWFRYDAPDKRLFKELQKTLMASADQSVSLKPPVPALLSELSRHVIGHASDLLYSGFEFIF